MLQEEIDGLTLSELMDILVDNTMKLMREMHKKNADGITIRDMRINLQLIQKAIENKKSNKLQMA